MAPNTKAKEKFVDLLDIYNQNQSDLNNGIFNDLSAQYWAIGYVGIPISTCLLPNFDSDNYFCPL